MLPAAGCFHHAAGFVAFLKGGQSCWPVFWMRMSEAEANGWMGNGWSWRRTMSRSWKNAVLFL